MSLESGLSGGADDHIIRSRGGYRLHEAVHESGDRHPVQDTHPNAYPPVLVHEPPSGGHMAVCGGRLHPGQLHPVHSGPV